MEITVRVHLSTHSLVRFVFALLVLAGLALLPHRSAGAAAVSWDGGGGDLQWETATNWSGDAVPTDADDVTINVTGTIQINAATTINSLTIGGGAITAPVLSFDYDALGGSPLTLDDGNLLVNSNGTITHTEGTSAVVGTVSIVLNNGDATIAGSINVSGKGYDNGEGPGAGADGAGAGGASYGGNGGIGMAATRGTIYGDYTAPTQMGSGGGTHTATNSNEGGGAVKISAVNGTVTVSGTIVASGDSPGATRDGGGSGGMVYILADELAGSGSITANGGNGGTFAIGGGAYGGGGGGGIISIYYNTDSSSLTYAAYGGAAGNAARSGMGGAGKIYRKDNQDTYGDMLIDNNDQLDAVEDRYYGTTVFDVTDPLSTHTFKTLTLRNAGILDVNQYTGIAYTTLTWDDRGIIKDNGGTIPLLATAADVTVPGTAILYANTDKTWNSLGVTASAILTADASTTAAADISSINLTITTDFTIAGTVNMNGKGYLLSEGTGAGVDGTGAGGGANGGNGGAGVGSAGGTAYASTEPDEPGSGGGLAATAANSNGGGLVIFTVGDELTLNGDITVDGEAPGAARDGGGAGGSVKIVAGTFSGDGGISADGGQGGTTSAYGGGGGGGVIYVVTTVANTFSGTMTVAGGAAGGAGASAGSAGLSTVYAAPTVASVTGVQATDGTKVVTSTFIVDDPDDEDLTAKIEYSNDGGSTWFDPTLGTTATGTYGTPAVNNASAYQVSTLTTASGANTITVTWNAGTDFSAEDTDYRIRVTANDGFVDGTAASSSNFSVDTVDPATGTVSYPENTDADTSTFTGTGWENGSNLFVNGVDTGTNVGSAVFGATGFSHTVDLSDGVGDNAYVVKTTDSYGNSSSEVSFTIVRTAATGGSPITLVTTTVSNSDTEEEEDGQDEESIIVEEPAEDGDYSMSGDEPLPEVLEEIGEEDGQDEGTGIAGEAEEEPTGETATQTPASAPEPEIKPTSEPVTTYNNNRLVEISVESLEQALREKEESERTQKLLKVDSAVQGRERLFGALGSSGLPEGIVNGLLKGITPSADLDSDGDGVTDVEEILLGRNPYYEESSVQYGIAAPKPPRSIQEELELEGEMSTYMEDKGFSLGEFGHIDSDKDGLSDWIEFLYGTDPEEDDSDGDDYSDGEELLFMSTNPLGFNEGGEGGSVWGIHIGNLSDGDESNEGEQNISGIGSAETLVEVYDLQEDESMNLVGRGVTDENGFFSVNTRYLTEGEHFLLAVEKVDGMATAISNLVKLSVHKDLALIRPSHDSSILEYGDKKPVSEVRLGLRNEGEQLRQSLDLDREIIQMITWESTIFGQAVIADSSSLEGTLIFLPPIELELGDHDVSWYTMDLQNGVRSAAGNLEFSVVPTALLLTNTTDRLNLLPAIVSVAILIGLLIYLRRKKAR